ncbi:hypothetical protein QJS10_CPA07g00761 [Acorus calamus]|uniref:Uncharacterized protein n=1 Tax=Acorus calamus TaxID=4465 RepID=A0AAV9EGN3_ACOCL|nr:hypothetical protein QJS10_CPA07g00761 [Acorus calamus]
MENIHLPEHEAGMWQWVFGKSVKNAFLCSIKDVMVSNTVDPRVRNIVNNAEVMEYPYQVLCMELH